MHNGKTRRERTWIPKEQEMRLGLWLKRWWGWILRWWIC